MKRKWLAFSMTLASLALQGQENPHVERMHSLWNNAFPTQWVIQNAGNMGAVSTGIGWSYGHRRQWETQLLLGYIPKHQSTRAKITMTVKQNYMPWSVQLKPAVSWQPLRCGVYFNTVFGHEFWGHLPERYPKEYYGGLPTMVRANFFVGQQVQLDLAQMAPSLHIQRVALFAELSACDIYLQPTVLHSGLGLDDLLTLSFGATLQL